TPIAKGLATADGSTAPLSWKVRPGLEVALDNAWKHMRCPVVGIEPTANAVPVMGYPAPSQPGATLVIDPACWANNMTNVPNQGYPFNGAGLPRLDNVSWVDDVYELLAKPGQFFLDSGSAVPALYYIPRAGEDMATADVELPLTPTL